MPFGQDEGYDASSRGKYRPRSDMLYDSSSSLIFMACLLLMYCVPAALQRWWSWRRNRVQEAAVARGRCHCSGCSARHAREHVKVSAWRRAFRRPGNWLLALAWLALAVLLVAAARSSSLERERAAHFDPYEVLGVSARAGKEEISRAYRRRSLELHPDKNLDNPNYRPQDFVRLNQAYRVLTDPVAAENYQRYGNPDGFQGTKYGIALPVWVVERGNVVLLVYGVLMIAVFPALVGIWWRRRLQLVTDHVSRNTYQLFAELLASPSAAVKFRNYPELYGAALEFEKRTPFAPELGDGEAVSRLLQVLQSLGRFDHQQQKLFNRGLPHFTMNNVILNAYLARLDLGSLAGTERLQRHLEVLLRHVDLLIPAMVDVAGAVPRAEVAAKHQGVFSRGGYVDRVIRAVQLSQSLCQAMLPTDSELLQLPGFGASEVKVCAANKRWCAGGVRTLADFRQHVWEADRRAMRGEARDAASASRMRYLLRMMSDAQLADIDQFMRRYPRAVRLEVVQPYVIDNDRSDDQHEYRDTGIHALDTVTLEVRIGIEREECMDPASGPGECRPCCRRLPYEKREAWWLVLGDAKLNAVVHVKRLPLSQAVVRKRARIVRDSGGKVDPPESSKESDDDDDDDDDEMEGEEEECAADDVCEEVLEHKFQFYAPPQPGAYKLVVHALPDCYLGLNRHVVLDIDVQERKLPQPETRYFDPSDLSDEEEGASIPAHESSSDSEEEEVPVESESIAAE